MGKMRFNICLKGCCLGFASPGSRSWGRISRKYLQGVRKWGVDGVGALKERFPMCPTGVHSHWGNPGSSWVHSLEHVRILSNWGWRKLEFCPLTAVCCWLRAVSGSGTSSACCSCLLWGRKKPRVLGISSHLPSACWGSCWRHVDRGCQGLLQKDVGGRKVHSTWESSRAKVWEQENIEPLVWVKTSEPLLLKKLEPPIGGWKASCPPWVTGFRGGISVLFCCVCFSALHIWRFELKVGFIRRNLWRRIGLLPHFPFVNEPEKEFRTVAAEDWSRLAFTAAQGGPSWLPSRLSSWLLSWLDSSFFL